MLGLLDRHQALVYLTAIAAGALAGWFVPGLGAHAAPAVAPVLALLLYATFLGIPLRRLGEGLRDLRFLACVLVLNFVVVPAVVLCLVRIAGLQGPLLVGALLVLLAPCVDYVIVFTGLAGGAAERLLSAAPVLMLGQLVLLPVLLRLHLGPDESARLDPVAVGEALVVIAVPLLAAGTTQWATERRPGVRVWEAGVAAAMVPLMVLTLATVVASQVAGVGSRVAELLPLLPVYLAFAAIMTLLGRAAGSVAGLGAREHRAVIFSGVTRNSLVVLPLALTLPGDTGLAPLAVVTQTLVELLVMVALVAVVPRLVPARRV
ncbi:arsenic resistance protein [Kocuria rhizophila]|uniref:arsenic resistance protein n=1 Tax=Kocuria rhizophila TaxID=72000 RepID=UPI0005803D10|nr:bile acid:sodium symporter [Kocuria rhizophila]KIC69675.1 arsenic resistance protein [Kocuria rhizophila]